MFTGHTFCQLAPWAPHAGIFFCCPKYQLMQLFTRWLLHVHKHCAKLVRITNPMMGVHINRNKAPILYHQKDFRKLTKRKFGEIKWQQKQLTYDRKKKKKTHQYIWNMIVVGAAGVMRCHGAKSNNRGSRGGRTCTSHVHLIRVLPVALHTTGSL